ncbi:MAG: hypothetical protein K6G38_03720 [Gammaproteobacteria bacterium]|nr:hypothetical protein [Gammaproteobacteria bacterium]
MIKDFIFKSENGGFERKCNIYLPKDYDNLKRYPVIYCFDGDNLYDPKNTLSGYAWELDKVIEKLTLEGVTKGFIVVGVYSSKNRLNEYSPTPYKTKYHIRGRVCGDKTLLFFDDLREFIDKEYMTNGVNHILGSSCGGIMSLYFISQRSDVYSTAGVFSIASGLLKKDYYEMIKSSPLNSKNIFLYMGDKEIFRKGEDEVSEVHYVYDLLNSLGANTELVIGENRYHDESAWRDYSYNYIRFIEKVMK